MNTKRTLWRRCVRYTLGVFLIVLLVPYANSRFRASSNRVKIRSPEPDARGEREILDHPASQLRVLAYNIAHGRGLAKSNWDGGTPRERKDRLDAIAKLFIEIDADIVILNEVDFDCSWSGHTNQARYLAEKAGYPHWAEQRNLDFRVLGWTWRFGNAVLSKHAILDSKPIGFPAYAEWEPLLAGQKRGMWCDIRAHDRSKTVRVFPVHLSPRSEHLRVRSSKTILREIRSTDLPAIVAGDFNSTPQGYPGHTVDDNGHNAIATMDRCDKLTRHHNADVNAEQFTFPANDPNRVIDWIFVPSNSQLLEQKVISSQLSDHLPVLTTIETK